MSALLGFEKEVPSKKCKECETIFYRTENQRGADWKNKLFCTKKCLKIWQKNDPKTIQKAKEYYERPDMVKKRKKRGKDMWKEKKKLFLQDPKEYEKYMNYHNTYSKKHYHEDLNAKKRQQEASKKSNAIRWANETPKEKELRAYKNYKCYLKRKYNLTPDQLQKMIDEQNGVCTICKDPKCQSKNKKLCVDHNHKTGRVRGILGQKCNSAIGMVRENPEILKRIIMYLFKHETFEILEKFKLAKKEDHKSFEEFLKDMQNDMKKYQSLLDSILISPAEVCLEKKELNKIKEVPKALSLIMHALKQTHLIKDMKISIDEAIKSKIIIYDNNKQEWIKNV